MTLKSAANMQHQEAIFPRDLVPWMPWAYEPNWILGTQCLIL